MKKEFIALTVLVLMFAAALVNIYFIGRLTDSIVELVTQADEYVEAEKWDMAQKKTEEAFAKWEGFSGFTHVVLHHSQIEDAGDMISELLKEIYDRNAGAARGAALAAKTRLKSVASIERVRLGNIFAFAGNLM